MASSLLTNLSRFSWESGAGSLLRANALNPWCFVVLNNNPDLDLPAICLKHSRFLPMTPWCLPMWISRLPVKWPAMRTRFGCWSWFRQFVLQHLSQRNHYPEHGTILAAGQPHQYCLFPRFNAEGCRQTSAEDECKVYRDGRIDPQQNQKRKQPPHDRAVSVKHKSSVCS